MSIDDYIQFCAGLAGASLDRPFAGEEIVIARHAANLKWFAALMLGKAPLFVNLKCAPTQAGLLRLSFDGIKPGYHMNKQHWISVYFESDVPDDLLKQLTLASHELTRPRTRVKRSKDKP